MCERVWRNAQDCAVKQGFAARSHGLQVARRCTQVKHAEKLNRHANCSTTGQKIQTGHSVSSRLELTTQSSHQSTLLWKNWLFAFLSHSSINTPYTHEILRASRENFEKETLEKNKIDSSTIFTYRLFKFLYSYPFHCYILERYITKTFSHHTHICEEAVWCLGSS